VIAVGKGRSWAATIDAQNIRVSVAYDDDEARYDIWSNGHKRFEINEYVGPIRNVRSCYVVWGGQERSVYVLAETIGAGHPVALKMISRNPAGLWSDSEETTYYDAEIAMATDGVPLLTSKDYDWVSDPQPRSGAVAARYSLQVVGLYPSGPVVIGRIESYEGVNLQKILLAAESGCSGVLWLREGDCDRARAIARSADWYDYSSANEGERFTFSSQGQLSEVVFRRVARGGWVADLR